MRSQRWLAMSLLSAAWIGIASPLTAADQPFLWVVENSNRVMADDSAQDVLERELCRALDCSKGSPSASEFPPCRHAFGVHRAKADRQIALGRTDGVSTDITGLYCPRERLKSEQYWEVLPKRFHNQARTVWNPQTLTYERADDYLHGRTRTIVAWRPDPGTAVCFWKLEGVDAAYVKGSCHEAKRKVTIDRPYTLWLKLEQPDGTITEASRALTVRDVLLVGLGDSYSSGEGNPHSIRTDRSPALWWDRRCHRSLLSFSTQAVTMAAILDRKHGTDIKHSFTHLNFACSGAEIKGEKDGDGGMLTEYVGRVTTEQWSGYQNLVDVGSEASYPGQRLKSQLDQLERHLCSNGSFPCSGMRKPEYIVLTIGGNDIGFGPLLREYLTSCKRRNGKCESDLIEQRIVKLRNHFNDLAARINKIGVNKKVLLLEYIDLTKDASRTFCDDFSVKRTLGPEWVSFLAGLLNIRPRDFGYGVSAQESERAYRLVLTKLNHLLKDVAESNRAAGWVYASGVARQSEVKGWCADRTWFVRFDDSMTKQGALPEKGWWNQWRWSDTETTGIAHPNIYGHNFLAYRVRCQMELDGILPPTSTQEGGKTAAKDCD